ncbi:uncharacterized protein [Chelonus insularis]|uniref:uncharacterized protein isoform X1 n=1 Tax=Chelonus insularis TaxID=460826 RepID=UPI00158E42F5|nr:uncharacterized protein LOC118067082 isoform X1 [Chelonus insularis]
MMIVNLIPLFLAARLNSSATPWSNGDKAKATYLVQDYAIKSFSAESKLDLPDEVFKLNALLTCQFMFKNLQCYFHNVDVQTTYLDEKYKSEINSKFLYEDMWVKKSLVKVSLEVEVTNNEYLIVWISASLEPTGRAVMASLFEPLNLMLNFSSRLSGNFKVSANQTLGICQTSYYVMESSATLSKSNDLGAELFLFSRPDETLDKPLQILRKIEDEKCAAKNYARYSPFAVKELKMKANGVNIEMHSLDSSIGISRHNFTSLTKNVFSVTNSNTGTKYIVDESLSVTLQKIEEIRCDESKSSRDCVTEEALKH